MNADGRGQPKTTIAGMGELKVVNCSAGEQVCLKTTVGSCVGLFMANAANRTYGVAHIMLPATISEDGALGKYADTAVPQLLRLVSGAGNNASVTAYVVGGASMFETDSHSFVADIGRKNVEAVLAIVRKLGVPIVHEETGGNRGRTVTFNCEDASIVVKTLQKPAILSREGSGE